MTESERDTADERRYFDNGQWHDGGAEYDAGYERGYERGHRAGAAAKIEGIVSIHAEDIAKRERGRLLGEAQMFLRGKVSRPTFDAFKIWVAGQIEGAEA